MIRHNKRIRNAFKEAIEAYFDGEIFTTRQPDPRGLHKYMNIYLTDSEVNQDEGIKANTFVELVVGVHIALNGDQVPTDDDLDELGELVIEAIEKTDIAPDILRGILPGSFEYPAEEEGEFSSLHLRFGIYF